MDASKPSRLWLIPLVCVPSIYLLFLYPSPEFCAYNKNDAAWFLTLGINLAEHGRYTADTYPVEQFGRHATWPFVFPFVLAGIVKVFGVSWFVLKLLMVSLGLLGLVLLLWLWKEDPIGRWAVLLTALNPVYFLFSHHTMTEVPFIVLCAGTLLCMSKSKTPRGALGAGCLATLAFFTRGYSVTFLPAALVFYLLRRDTGSRLRARILAFVCFAFPLVVGIVGWSIWTNARIEAGPVDSITASYGTSSTEQRLRVTWREFAQEIYWYQMRSPLHLVAPIASWSPTSGKSDFIAVAGTMILLVAAVGWLRSFTMELTSCDAWLPFMVVMLLVFDTSQPRYWLMLLPFILYYILNAVDWLAERFANRPIVVPSLARGVLLVLALLGLLNHLHQPNKMRFLTDYWRDYRDLGLWCHSNLPDDAIVVTHTPANMYVTARRRTLEWTSLSEHRLDTLQRDRVYFVCPPQDAEDPHAQAALDSCQELLRQSSSELVHQHQGQKLYRYAPGIR